MALQKVSLMGLLLEIQKASLMADRTVSQMDELSDVSLEKKKVDLMVTRLD